MRDTRELIRVALASRRQDRLDAVLLGLALVGTPDTDTVEAMVKEELEAQPHDVRSYWLGPCDCQRQVQPGKDLAR